ncbi:hypothetical protein AUJ83_00580 [Candidatus Woesearchaeota archaeon CG1_02_33_12]|nr:MAG: hypothetical protein AUJ83_00580 [Candidatus Woesearchaeota archaeon CG1_02_33_12]
MPNWCCCTLNISGDKRERNKFKEFAKGKTRRGDLKVLCEDKFIPYPKLWADMDRDYPGNGKVKYGTKEYDIKLAKYKKKYGKDKDGFNSGGYEWCKENYGTKWGFCDPQIALDSKYDLEYSFESAWSPPEPLIKKMSEMFPKLEFSLTYDEPGNCYGGETTFAKGKIKSETFLESKEYLENIKKNNPDLYKETYR